MSLDGVGKGYIDDSIRGAQWREPVETANDLAQLDDALDTVRMALDTGNAYIKDGPRWVPFVAAGSDAPFPASIAVDVVTRLGDVARDDQSP